MNHLFPNNQKHWWLLAVALFQVWNCMAQQLPFHNYSVDKGLIQSQVLAITQDAQHHLWVGTYSGLDRFDGSSFTHFNKSDGLASNSITALYTGIDGKIWIGTFNGLSSYDGYQFANYTDDENAGITSIAADSTGAIWAFRVGKGLFQLKNNKLVKAVMPSATARPTCFQKTNNRKLRVSFHQLGIFEMTASGWKKIQSAPELPANEFIVASEEHNGHMYYATNKKRILKYRDGRQAAVVTLAAEGINTMSIDRKGNIWIGTAKGAYVLGPKNLEILYTANSASGLSDNYISEIFNDLEGNVWLGSDGDGLFRFSGALFAKFDKSTGLPGNVVMGFCKDSQEQLFIATREGGLVRRKKGIKTFEYIDYSKISKFGINCIGAGTDGIYFGTMDNKLLCYQNGDTRLVTLDKEVRLFINTIKQGNQGLYFATNRGAYVLKNGTAQKIPGITQLTAGILPLNGNETLLGTMNGLYEHHTGEQAKKVNNAHLAKADILCLELYKDFVLVGTADEGLIFWHRPSGKTFRCDSKSGLSDNQVFGIFIDSTHRIWVGTGTGLHTVAFNSANETFLVRKFSATEGYEQSETNLNALAQDENGDIWVGTTKGAFVYHEQEGSVRSTPPFVVIQQVNGTQLITDSTTRLPWYGLPEKAEVLYHRNNISFTVKGIQLGDPENLMYTARLSGMDTGYSPPAERGFFNYQHLEPGKYIFQVRAISRDGIYSSNTAEFPFTVTTPFHKSGWFYALMSAGLLMIGIGIQTFLYRLKRKRQMTIELLRKQEQEKIRQQTAEDFHDELGNKLTRISLLTDILEKNLAAGPMQQKAEILQQIRDNVSGLYSGTKEVIWSLSPGSGSLREIFKRIQFFGNELFNNSSIDFEFRGKEQVNDWIQVPVDYSRNIMMIAKEVLNNILRHSGGTRAAVEIHRHGEQQIRLIFSDNGKGFDATASSIGNGLKNIRERAERIHATLMVDSQINSGTRIVLDLKIPPKEG